MSFLKSYSKTLKFRTIYQGWGAMEPANFEGAGAGAGAFLNISAEPEPELEPQKFYKLRLQ